MEAMYYHFITSHSRLLSRIINFVHGDILEGLCKETSPQNNSQKEGETYLSGSLLSSISNWPGSTP